MKAILLLYDSLTLKSLACHGGPHPTPNFDRLAARSMVFDNHYVGSLPCMPARRDLQTGRLNFLHRSWGPLEPFDVTATDCLRRAGVHSHLVTDHYHYFENGGATYHTAFDSWAFIRGQEADPWVPCIDPPHEEFAAQYHPEQVETAPGGYRLQAAMNRSRICETPDFPTVRTFDAGLAFLDDHAGHDDWFLQIEVFDPHEPFHAPPEYRAAFPTTGEKLRDWPRYRRDEAGDDTDDLRASQAALVAMCDAQLGRLLDAMDAGGMWDDTALIVTTDHGFMLGEHGWWGKNRMPFFSEIARIPLFIHAPGQAPGRSAALSQNIDVMATLLELFHVEPPATVQGRALLNDAPGRALALYGTFGGAINATDGRYTYFRYPPDMEAAPLFEYTLMPQHSGSAFTAQEMRGAALHPEFDFTDGMPVLKIPALPGAKRPPMQGGGFDDTKTVLYDLSLDPGQTTPLDDPAIEARFCAAIAAAMQAHDAPPELYDRFDLQVPR
ncbi:sulfatase [Oceaniglobus trochenteri]|uniref:sulfatase n=1 Tax=Oceaniglobus trochenteri TaxID=2763260 RepID=UPI001CFFD0E5|nr:sulfatase [Oceaniglobus trochenteri]